MCGFMTRIPIPCPFPPHTALQTLKMAFACVHQLPAQLSNSQFSLQGQGWSRCTESWIQTWGTSQGTHFWGSHSLSPKESRGDCFHLKFLESPGLFGTWRVTPNFQPHEKGVGGELGTGCGRYGSVLALALTGRGLSPAQAPFWGAEGDGAGGGTQGSGPVS